MQSALRLSDLVFAMGSFPHRVRNTGTMSKQRSIAGKAWARGSDAFDF